VSERASNAGLLAALRLDKPDVVFNLCSVYDWEKTYLIPGVLEIAGVPYTGSGILGLSLARNRTKLFPLLCKSRVRTPGFEVIKTGAPLRDGLRYPLALWRDGLRASISLKKPEELARALARCPASEEVLLQEQPKGERLSLYLLDRNPFLEDCDPLYLQSARQAYDLLEARGLARFDFIQTAGRQVLLEHIAIAPDPLDEQFLGSLAESGWDKARLLHALLQQAGRDHAAGD
jgi:hypothetical protein